MQVFCQEGDSLGVAAIADSDVHRAAGIHGVIVDRRCALIRMHVTCMHACTLAVILAASILQFPAVCSRPESYLTKESVLLWRGILPKNGARSVQVRKSPQPGVVNGVLKWERQSLCLTIEEDIHSILICERLEADAHLLKLLVGGVRRVPAPTATHISAHPPQTWIQSKRLPFSD